MVKETYQTKNHKESTLNYGKLNEHTVGIVMKEMVRRALEAIRDQRFIFEAKAKEGRSGKMDDLVTSADHAAQAIYVKMMREMFPTYGIVAEEDGLHQPCTDTELGDIYFTVDPLDGTKAFGRRQSHGIGTMISLVHNEKVIAAFIGDVMTREIYGFRPGSCCHRISEYGHAERINAPSDIDLHERHVLLRSRPENYSSSLIRALCEHSSKGGAFKDIEITGGSIGISMARLWKNEVGAAVIGAGDETPWDANPISGICENLGYVFLKPDDNARRFRRVRPVISMETTKNEHARLVIHESLLHWVEAWQDTRITD